MLKLTIASNEYFDERLMSFITLPEKHLILEHSLRSISVWESIFEKPFLSNATKTTYETAMYVVCMSADDIGITDVYRLTSEDHEKISEYINAKKSATKFYDAVSQPSLEAITSELIYYWMVALQIPFECDAWHLNRLLSLIKLINKKNSPKKHMSQAEIAARNREINEQRLKQYDTTG